MFENIVLLINEHPKIGIILIAIALSFFISIINYIVLDKTRIKELKEKQKKLTEEAKEHKKAGNSEKAMQIQKQLLSMVGENMKLSFKPMLITIIPILVVFSMIRNVFAETTIAGSWFWWYIGAAVISSMVFRKVFKLP